MARDLIRQIQELRKESGLQVSDRIALEITASTAAAEAYSTWTSQIAAETLAERGVTVTETVSGGNDAVQLVVVGPTGERHTRTVDLSK